MDSNIFIKILTLLPDNVFRVCVSFFLFFLGVGCELAPFQHHLTTYNMSPLRDRFYKVGTEATFSCLDHSYLIGPKKSTCEASGQASGSWVPEPGRCSRKFHY